MFNYLEIIGIVASIFIFLSLCFKTRTFKGSMLLRILNSLGCIVFIVYGCLLPAWSTAIANGLCLILNCIYIIVEVRGYLKNERKSRASVK